MASYKIGFIGGGMMAEAMLGGLLSRGLPRDHAMVSEPVPQRREYMERTFNVAVKESNTEVCEASDVVVMAVKPQVLEAVLADLQAKSQANPKVAACLIISIVAGKTLATYQKYLPNCRVARVMPNTPALVGCGASCYVLNGVCTNQDSATVESVMGSCGIVERVADEKLLDAVTGLSGSGPAYVYLLIEAMADGGVRMGLPRQTAMRLAAQTVMGAGKMALEAGKHPGELKDAVTSPGGTTIAGVHALESGAFRGTVINAVEAATKRSQELGRS
uniref:Pyrroline-5-carboxylate reductase n=1 Tax=Alexandrium catenella TaxID=2925 RepID=A0A7S1WQM1_ALECA|mmetsp:Transcript_81427/g.216105  ORF Transcript_81427/g.216105 Transcript_81427/m.216105 type:complete len:275 (+) Transcript_81427:52-876(+)